MHNYGIDMLKILGMLFIIILHILGHGGVLQVATGNAYNVVWLIETVCYCGANCYALVSGFIGYKNDSFKWKWKKYILLLLQTIVVGTLVSTMIYLIYPNRVSPKYIIKGMLPLTFNQYWYFTAYTGVFILMPLLNKIVQRLNSRTIFISVTALSCYTTVSSFIGGGDVFALKNGYSFVWLSILYIIGAVIKKEGLYKKIRNKMLIFSMIMLSIIIWLWKVYIGVALGNAVGLTMDYVLMQYIAPTVLGVAICYVLLFAKLNVNSKIKNVVKNIAASTYGVYIFHENIVFREIYIAGQFKFIVNYSEWLIPCIVIIIALSIFLVGILMDKIWNGFYYVFLKRAFNKMFKY